jgi:CRP-like cAMP-binding protein
VSGGATQIELPVAPPAKSMRPFLEAIGELPRAELLAFAERRSYASGDLMLAELEPGDEMLILLVGRAAVAVGASELRGEERLGEIAEGQSVGEIALLTGALRSASVRALVPVTALALRREQLLGLMARFPVIADHFLALLASRLSSADHVLAEALDPSSKRPELLGGLDRQTREIAVQRRSAFRLLSRAFRELLVEHRRELPFFLLTGFLGSFIAARIGLWGLSQLGFSFEPLLRSAYVGGVLLLLASAGLSPFVYRRPVRVALCLAFGIGGGLIVNELSVWLSFDIFYRDIFTRDPTLVFDPALLYHRSTTLWVFTVIVALLSQATYLSRFYRRAFYILRDRWSARR